MLSHKPPFLQPLATLPGRPPVFAPRSVSLPISQSLFHSLTTETSSEGTSANQVLLHRQASQEHRYGHRVRSQHPAPAPAPAPAPQPSTPTSGAYHVGYARVSTFEQTLDLQLDALQKVHCQQIYTDTASGANAVRPGLEKALEHLRPGDTLVVWRLDRLGRSLRHLIDTITTLEQRGIGFKSLSESIDTTTSTGKLVFHLFGAIAEFERDLIRERTQAGLQAARARGRRGGTRAPRVSILPRKSPWSKPSTTTKPTALRTSVRRYASHGPRSIGI
jgi:DNA invertase Pin-like site-specific DNA recombinase